MLGLIDHEVKPVTPRPLDVSLAMGRTLAADVAAPPRPASATALADGWALAADLTLGAGGYAPALLPRVPTRVEAGQPMPPGTDSVAPFDAVKESAAGAEVLAAVNPGDGVLAAGGDCEPGLPLRRAGDRLRPLDLAVFAAAGLARVTVREPRLRVLPLRGSTIVSAAARLVATDIERRGGAVRIDEPGAGSTSRWRPRTPTPSSLSAAPAPAVTTPVCMCWRAKRAWRCTGSRWRRAKPRRSALPALGRCCCCREGSMPRSRSG